MINSITNIIRNAISDDQPRHILVSGFNEAFERTLAENTSHIYYIITDNAVSNDSVPSNVHLLSSNIASWSISLHFDLIICNSIIHHIELCNRLSHEHNIPMIIIHHIMKPGFVKKEDIQILGENYKNCLKIATCQHIKDSWRENCDIIPYGIKIPDDGISQSVIQNKILVHDRLDPDGQNIIRVLKERTAIPITIAPVDTSYVKFLELLKEHTIYINWFGQDDVNINMLTAMAYGKIVLSSASQLNNDLITNKYNGFIISSLNELLSIINTKGLLDDQQFTLALRRNAQNTIKHQFDINSFADKWNKLIDKVSHTMFRI